MTIFQAFLIALIFWLITSLEAWFAYPMINTPIVLCPIVGLILGDVQTGIITGATLQLIFMGVIQVGGTMPADAGLGSVLGTALVIANGHEPGIAITFAVPVAMLGTFLTLFGYLIRGMFNPLTEKFCEEGNDKALEKLHVALAFLPELPKGFILFLALAFGSGFAKAAVDAIPQFVTSGLDYASDLMPAVGIALLLRMMWSKKLAVYFFAGFILVSLFNISLLGVAALGVVFVVILYLESYNKEQGKVAVVSSDSADEEDLFND